ncbi:hypothetical protein K488DRAFT_67497 [Vararia minispora EC-137]|uniref:Uncharacterized protein n=1 Tax=Vararia minispora EC-137 TaxID=1314806 RepID=A0ACB8QZ78_9AGAM|nr:hypothetical protein K488DRAFT_67497 [Vararia minispora EC-137]
MLRSPTGGALRHHVAAPLIRLVAELNRPVPLRLLIELRITYLRLQAGTRNHLGSLGPFKFQPLGYTDATIWEGRAWLDLSKIRAHRLSGRSLGPPGELQLRSMVSSSEIGVLEASHGSTGTVSLNELLPSQRSCQWPSQPENSSANEQSMRYMPYAQKNTSYAVGNTADASVMLADLGGCHTRDLVQTNPSFVRELTDTGASSYMWKAHLPLDNLNPIHGPSPASSKSEKMRIPPERQAEVMQDAEQASTPAGHTNSRSDLQCREESLIEEKVRIMKSEAKTTAMSALWLLKAVPFTYRSHRDIISIGERNRTGFTGPGLRVVNGGYASASAGNNDELHWAQDSARKTGRYRASGEQAQIIS